MPSYAILPSADQGRLDRALLIVADRHEADEVAAEPNEVNCRRPASTRPHQLSYTPTGGGRPTGRGCGSTSDRRPGWYGESRPSHSVGAASPGLTAVTRMCRLKISTHAGKSSSSQP